MEFYDFRSDKWMFTGTQFVETWDYEWQGKNWGLDLYNLTFFMLHVPTSQINQLFEYHAGLSLSILILRQHCEKG